MHRIEVMVADNYTGCFKAVVKYLKALGRSFI
jgi:hypothetical protein